MHKKIVLRNGLRLILAPQPTSFAATALILVEAGSEYETKDINGVSHFLEHMVFKGTTKRPEASTISSELDSLGAEYNAFTGQEYTGYWAKVQNKKIAEILDIVADMYLNPLFKSEEIDKERGVIIEEINLYEDTPTRRVHDLFTTLLYGNQPAGWDIGGRKEVIRKLKREDFIKYRAAHYVAPATVVAIAGNFNVKRVMAQVKGLFGGLKRERKQGKSRTHESQSKPKMFLKFKESEQSHLVLGTRAFNLFDKRRYALQVLSDVLGGGMSSRLFRRVREELGAAYYVRAGSELSIDHGYLSVSAGVDHLKIEKVIAIVLEEMNRLKKEEIPRGELQKAKDHLSGSVILGLETSDELAGFYGGEEIATRSIEEPEVLIKKIQKVTAEEIRKVAQDIFQNAKLNMVVIGPYKKEDTFKRILKL